MAFVCSSDIYWALSETLLHALGHVLGPQGYRAHGGCSARTPHCVWGVLAFPKGWEPGGPLTLGPIRRQINREPKCFVGVLSPNLHRTFPRCFPHGALTIPDYMCQLCTLCTCKPRDTGYNGKAVGRLLLVLIPGPPLEYLPQQFTVTSLSLRFLICQKGIRALISRGGMRLKEIILNRHFLVLTYCKCHPVNCLIIFFLKVGSVNINSLSIFP